MTNPYDQELTDLQTRLEALSAEFQALAAAPIEPGKPTPIESAIGLLAGAGDILRQRQDVNGRRNTLETLGQAYANNQAAREPMGRASALARNAEQLQKDIAALQSRLSRQAGEASDQIKRYTGVAHEAGIPDAFIKAVTEANR